MSPLTTSRACGHQRGELAQVGPAGQHRRPAAGPAPSATRAASVPFVGRAGDHHPVPPVGQLPGPARRTARPATAWPGPCCPGARTVTPAGSPAGRRAGAAPGRRGRPGCRTRPAAGTSGPPRARRRPSRGPSRCPASGLAKAQQPARAGGSSSRCDCGPAPVQVDRHLAAADRDPASRARSRPVRCRHQPVDAADQVDQRGQPGRARPAPAPVAGTRPAAPRSAGTAVARSPTPSARSTRITGTRSPARRRPPVSRTAQPGGWESANMIAAAVSAGSLSIASGPGPVLRVAVVEERGPHPARDEQGHPDLTGQLGGERPGEADHPELRRAVRGGVADRLDAQGGGDRDDAAPGRLQVRQRGPDHRRGGEQVHRDDPVPGLAPARRPAGPARPCRRRSPPRPARRPARRARRVAASAARVSARSHSIHGTPSAGGCRSSTQRPAAGLRPRRRPPPRRARWTPPVTRTAPAPVRPVPSSARHRGPPPPDGRAPAGDHVGGGAPVQVRHHHACARPSGAAAPPPAGRGPSPPPVA